MGSDNILERLKAMRDHMSQMEAITPVETSMLHESYIQEEAILLWTLDDSWGVTTVLDELSVALVAPKLKDYSAQQAYCPLDLCTLAA